MIPDFGKHTVVHEGLVLECAYKVPGLTLQDLFMIFDKAEEDLQPNDMLAADPGKWPGMRGVTALTNAILQAIYGPNNYEPPT